MYLSTTERRDDSRGVLAHCDYPFSTGVAVCDVYYGIL